MCVCICVSLCPCVCSFNQTGGRVYFAAFLRCGSVAFGGHKACAVGQAAAGSGISCGLRLARVAQAMRGVAWPQPECVCVCVCCTQLPNEHATLTHTHSHASTASNKFSNLFVGARALARPGQGCQAAAGLHANC